MTTLSLILLLLPAPPTGAAPRRPAPTFQSAQVQGILDSAVYRMAARRDIYWHRGDFPRIIALDRIITQADPQYLECYETGGWLMESLGDLSDAEAYYRQGVANNPRTAESYFHLGFFLFNTRKDYGRAASVFRQGTAQPDAGINDWKMLAHSYDQAHSADRAVAAWRHIKARWPGGVAVDRNLAEALARQRAARSGAVRP